MHTTSNPRMQKKQSSFKDGTHIHFDLNDSGATDTEDRLVDKKLKRQQEMIEAEKHEKIVKKPKIDENSEDRYKGHSYGMRQDLQPNYESSSRFIHKRSPRIPQIPQQVQKKSLELLKQLLLHLDINKQGLINPQVANKWILSPTTPTKIKSFLALYMILHHFDRIGFGFRKNIDFDGPEFKNIQIDKVEDRQIFNEELIREIPDYERYRENQFKKYLADYLEWLIWINEHIFETTKEDSQFWVMALNNCEKTSMELLRSTNQRQKAKNIVLASFLMNAQDIVFRQTSELPRMKNILYMDKEDLALLPSCHWILGLNFSVRYFYQKSLNERVVSSLSNIDKNELKEFYHEYQLLSSYFQKGCEPFEGSTLSDNILEWLANNSIYRQVFAKEKTSKFNPIRKICSSLLAQALSDIKDTNQVKDKLMLSIQLLKRDIFLSQQQKVELFSSIMYKDQKIAYKLGSQFPQAIKKLQHKKQAKIGHISQLITEKYSELYSHLILSEQPGIKNDLLTQFNHLTNISFKRQTPPVIERIAKIASSFNLLTHWNKDVLKTFVLILDKYLQKFDQFLQLRQHLFNNDQNSQMMEAQENQVENKHRSREKQNQELQALCSFIKIHLNLEPLNLDNLKDIIKLVNLAKNQQTQLPLEQKTIFFIKKNLLSIIFAKNGFYQSLLLSMKMFLAERAQKEQKMNGQTQIKDQNIIGELKKMAQGIKYFEDQVQLLSKEASNILISAQK